MNKKKMFVLMMLGIYAAGIASGVFVGRYLAMARGFMPGRHPHGPPPPEQVVEKFAKLLDLTPDQKQQVLLILKDNKDTVDRYRDEFGAKMVSTMDAVHTGIKAVLTEEQKAKFDKIIAKERRGKQGPDGKGPGGAPGEGREHIPPPGSDMPR